MSHYLNMHYNWFSLAIDWLCHSMGQVPEIKGLFACASYTLEYKKDKSISQLFQFIKPREIIIVTKST